jgi:hypothetical protein
MKHRTYSPACIIALMVIISIWTPGCSTTSSHGKTTQHAKEGKDEITSKLLRIEDEWAELDMLIPKNPTGVRAVLERIWATDYVSVGRDGKVRNNREAIATCSEDDGVESAVNSDMVVLIYADNVAVVTGIDNTKGKDKAGNKPPSLSLDASELCPAGVRAIGREKPNNVSVLRRSLFGLNCKERKIGWPRIIPRKAWLHWRTCSGCTRPILLPLPAVAPSQRASRIKPARVRGLRVRMTTSMPLEAKSSARTLPRKPLPPARMVSTAEMRSKHYHSVFFEILCRFASQISP